MKLKKISRAVLCALAGVIVLALLFSPPLLHSSFAQTATDTAAAACSRTAGLRRRQGDGELHA